MPEQIKGKILEAPGRPGIGWTNPKWVFTVRVSNAPYVATNEGERFIPTKVSLTDWGNRCKIEVSGMTMYGYHKQARTVMYGLGGYEKEYPKPPDWVLEIIRAAGFARGEF